LASHGPTITSQERSHKPSASAELRIGAGLMEEPSSAHNALNQVVNNLGLNRPLPGAKKEQRDENAWVQVPASRSLCRGVRTYPTRVAQYEQRSRTAGAPISFRTSPRTSFSTRDFLKDQAIPIPIRAFRFQPRICFAKDSRRKSRRRIACGLRRSKRGFHASR